jgi:hypothetical protein
MHEYVSATKATNLITYVTPVSTARLYNFEEAVTVRFEVLQSITVEGLQQTTKAFSPDSWLQGRDFNLTAPEYEGVLITSP